MLKLYKKTGNVTEYWEAWSTDNEVTLHWGIVGKQGETRTIQLESGETPNAIIAAESRRPKAEGYRKIPSSKHSRIIIQYQIDGMGAAEDMDKRFEVEGLMNERLGWMGLGDCDGGDTGSGTMNVFCFVVDAATAIPHIVAELKEKNLLDGAVIAISSEDGDAVVWPQNFSGEFSI